MKYYFGGALTILLALVAYFYLFVPEVQAPVLPDEMPEPQAERYVDSELGISFVVPEGYFAHVTDVDGERRQRAIVLFEDTPFTRSLVAGEVEGTEAPPAISIIAYQNDLDNYTTDSFINDTSFSNFKLSDGVLSPVMVAGVSGQAYSADGLYMSRNIVVARPDYVFMFTAGYHTPEDRMLADFDAVVASFEFVAPTPTSADNAPEGSMHNLPVPEAVSAVRAYAAQKAGVSVGSAIVMQVEEMDWSDSCLGLGGPDEMCAMMITSGYRVTVQAGGTTKSYRTDMTAGSIREEL